MKDIEENRMLVNNELSKVNGGYWGYNKYEKEVYHSAGFITEWHCFVTLRDTFLLRITSDKTAEAFYVGKANEYTDFYLSHTEEEYIEFVKREIPEYTRVIPGHDNSCA